MQREHTTLATDAHGHIAPQRVEVDGEEFTLFTESPPLISAMLKDIRAARQRVWLESYIFADDAAGRAVAEALAERAGAGLDVRLMIDGWGSFSTPNSLLARMSEAGVQVHVFRPIGQILGGLKFVRTLNQRNHRKLLVVDEGVAYFGGMNIVDQSGIHSLADAKDRHLPTSAGWRDVHARLAGERAADVADAFERLWDRVHDLPRGRQALWPIKQALAAEGEAIFFFDSRPAFKYRRPHRILVPLIRQAQHDITVAVAYFLPIGSVRRELVKARKRGVRVRIIVPGQSDVRLVQWATRHFYEYLLKRGFEIYERKDCMLHSKTMVIDGRRSIIGSCNLDARSLRLNLEFFALVVSTKLAAAILEICAEEIHNSVRVDAEYIRRRWWWERWRDRAAWAWRHWL